MKNLISLLHSQFKGQMPSATLSALGKHWNCLLYILVSYPLNNHDYMILTTNQEITQIWLDCSQLTNQTLDDFCLYMQLLFVKKLEIHFSITSTLLALLRLY